MPSSPCTTLAARHTARHRSLWQRLGALIALHRSRTRLSGLDAHLLRDIGITEIAARAEAQRPVWDAPDHWRR